MQGRVVVAVAAVVWWMLILARAAEAGTYRVWTCSGPDGKPTAIRDAASGWQQSLRAGTTGTELIDRCASGGGIWADMHAEQAHGNGGQWTFVPPSGTSIAAYSLTWSGV